MAWITGNGNSIVNNNVGDVMSTSFGQCVNVETTAQVAGESSGIKAQGVSVPTKPEYPATQVSLEGGKAFFDDGAGKKELNLNYVKGNDLSGEFQSPGTSD